MKISIITPSYNSVKTIEQTIKSVINQSGVDLEYIIIDGGSTDGSLDIINKYPDQIAKVVSEKDYGIYDAMNKGVKLATGEIIGIINSDDFYFNEAVLAQVVFRFENEKIDACYGDIDYVDKNETSKIVRVWHAGEYNEKKLNNGWIPPHPAWFCRREVYEKYGLYRTDMKLAADYEFMLRCLKVHKIQVAYLNEPLVHMRNEGASSKDVKQRLLGWSELKKGWTINKLSIPKFFIIRRIISKIPQFFSF